MAADLKMAESRKKHEIAENWIRATGLEGYSSCCRMWNDIFEAHVGRLRRSCLVRCPEADIRMMTSSMLRLLFSRTGSLYFTHL